MLIKKKGSVCHFAVEKPGDYSNTFKCSSYYVNYLAATVNPLKAKAGLQLIVVESKIRREALFTNTKYTYGRNSLSISCKAKLG